MKKRANYGSNSYIVHLKRAVFEPAMKLITWQERMGFGGLKNMVLYSIKYSKMGGGAGVQNTIIILVIKPFDFPYPMVTGCITTKQ